MGFSIKLMQQQRKGNESKEEPIYIRLYKDGKSKYVNTEIYVNRKDWNSNKRKVRTSHSRHLRYNEELSYMKNMAEDKAFELSRNDSLSLDLLKDQICSGEQTDIIDYADSFLKFLHKNEKHSAYKNFNVVKKDFNHFLGDRKLTVGQVRLKEIEDFQRYLLSDQKRGKENGINTVRRKMKSLKRMFRKARKEGTINETPFRDYKQLSREKPNRTALELHQIKSIKELDLEEQSYIWHVRNYFMFSYYNAGIRFGDLSTLRWKNLVDGRLKYQMMKTGNRKNIKQYDQMVEILSHYETKDKKPDDLIFPILDRYYRNGNTLRKKIGSRNVLVNRALKEIADKAKIQSNVSFHVSRHSFAHHAMKKDLGLNQISKALGHGDLKTTQDYLKEFDEQHLDKGMEKFLN